MTHPSTHIALLFVLILLPESAYANINSDAGITGAISSVQNALPAGSLAVLGAWAVLQYTEAWNVDDGPLAGMIAWWRWSLWMPPRAVDPRLSKVEASSVASSFTIPERFTHMPTISYSNLTTCWIFLILLITPVTRGIFWNDHGSYTVALFSMFVISWRALSKLVVAMPIPTYVQSAFTRHTSIIHDDKSRALNLLARHPPEAIYGVIARTELLDASPARVLNFLTSQGLCTNCQQVVEQQAAQESSWTLVSSLLELHDHGEECAVHHRPFRWIQTISGREWYLYSDDLHILNAALNGRLGAWRLQKSTIARRLRNVILFLAVSFPICFGFQLVLGLLTFAIPIYRLGGMLSLGYPYYVPLNNAIADGRYLVNGTLIDRSPSTNRTHPAAQLTPGAVFVALGLLAFIVCSIEARAARRRRQTAILTANTLRMASCCMMVFYSVFLGVFFSVAAGYDTRSGHGRWQTGIHYTFALLASGVFLGGSYAWRARNGRVDDSRSWPTPSFPQRYPAWVSTWTGYVHDLAGCVLAVLRACLCRRQPERPEASSASV